MKRATETEVRPLGRSLASRYSGQTIVAIGAHPDDLEIGIGGTLAKLARVGARVVMVVASIPKDFDVRIDEARRGAEILGCELKLLVEDGPKRLEDIKTCELVGMLDAVVREYQPAAMLTHSSVDFHNDHLLIYNACLPTQRHGFFDFMSYHPTNCRPVPIPFHPKVYVDVTETIDAKMHAITAHASQFGGRGLDTEMYREFAHVQGRLIGVPYAEGLEAVRMVMA
ncbi:MAG TPA: PIG-L deacetylase family protein [Usitatibacter sp.]|jgi:LmbE family N-acetylglucosaminyl deacetylase|nr:PIG-L deacetylase family protein [Usitatibacter sp.]